MDHSPYQPGVPLALHVLGAPEWWLRLGGRIGYLFASAPYRAPAGRPSWGSLDIHLVDLSFVTRMILYQVSTGFRTELEFTGGVVVGDVVYRSVDQLVVAPRVATGLFLGYAQQPTGHVVGIRIGYQYLPWNGAGRSAADPAFSGFFANIEIGAGL